MCLAVPEAAPWSLLAALPGAAYGAMRWRDAGWRLEDGRVAVSSRRLARTTVLAPTTRVQQHGVRQTVLQRRSALADIELRVGAGTRGHVRHLDAGVAGQLFDGLRRDEARSAGEVPPSTIGGRAPGVPAFTDDVATLQSDPDFKGPATL